MTAARRSGSTASVAEAKAKLSELLDRAAAGEEIVVTRSGKPIARLAPLREKSPRPFGVARHWPQIPDDALLAAMEADDLAWAEGAYTDDFGLTRPAKPRAPKKRRR
jgi:prevent-host-death family protein